MSRQFRVELQAKQHCSQVVFERRKLLHRGLESDIADFGAHGKGAHCQKLLELPRMGDCICEFDGPKHVLVESLQVRALMDPAAGAAIHVPSLIRKRPQPAGGGYKSPTHL